MDRRWGELMRLWIASVVLGFSSVWIARPAQAQTQTTKEPVRARISINGGLQSGLSTTFDGSTSKPLNLETATINTTYRVNPGISLDGGVAFTMRNHFGVGIAVSSFSKETETTVNAALPHPIFFQTPRAINGTPSGLMRNELVTHVQAVYVIGPIGRLDIAVGAGPSLFRVTHDFVSDVSFSDAYPYDSASFRSARTERLTRYKTGFNVGADVGLRMGRSVGFGALLRFSRASIDFPLPSGDHAVTADAGGLQAGAGLRLYF
jgi:hypothetical protein